MGIIKIKIAMNITQPNYSKTLSFYSLLGIFIFPFYLFSQQPVPSGKGAAPIAEILTNEKHVKNTYAVVVGISDYQDPEITDLRFADKDAEAFAGFLRSESGGKLDKDHLKVLLNQDATMAQFAIALDWLIENIKEGDHAIIYFSGHGDVEKKTLTQPGFLLCWDAPARVYMSGGAFALPMLQEVISTLSIQNKAKVIVITDACRSGTLAGNAVGGAQATASNLAKQFANEIKILSCQPNEYSIEGEQWGGGRGAFSFNLVNALYGLADNNKDLSITLQEIGRYLEDHVPSEVAPVSQLPMVLGNRNEKVATVNPTLLAALQSGKSSQMAMLSAIDVRGIEEDVLTSMDSTTKNLYGLFKNALKDKVFLEPASACAEVYYQRLLAQPKMARLHSTLTRNYAAALQDDAQQVLKTFLNTGLTKEVLSKVRSSKIYQLYPSYLKRAAELLGKEHYMYKSLMARAYFFEGKIQNTRKERDKYYRKALEWQPEMPHVWADMITVFSASQEDSARYYATKAASLVPNWIVPYALLVDYYHFVLKQSDKADSVLNYASNLDSNSVYLWYVKGSFYDDIGKFEESEKWYLKALHATTNEVCFPCLYNALGILYIQTERIPESILAYKKALQLDSTFIMAYTNLGFANIKLQKFEEARNWFNKALKIDPDLVDAHLGLGELNHILKNYDDAIQNLQKALQSNYTAPKAQAHAYNGIGMAYLEKEMLGQAEQALLKSIEIDSNQFDAHSNLGIVYHITNRFPEAEKSYFKALKFNPKHSGTYYNLASLKSKQNLVDAAYIYIEKAFQLGFQDYAWLIEDPDMELLRKQSDRWRSLLKKFFPKEFKD